MIRRTWKEGVLAGPAVGVSLLPKFVCPVCSPAYAALLSSLGLGFLISTRYLLPVTLVFLSLQSVHWAFDRRPAAGAGRSGPVSPRPAACSWASFGLTLRPRRIPVWASSSSPPCGTQCLAARPPASVLHAFRQKPAQRSEGS